MKTKQPIEAFDFNGMFRRARRRARFWEELIGLYEMDKPRWRARRRLASTIARSVRTAGNQ